MGYLDPLAGTWEGSQEGIAVTAGVGVVVENVVGIAASIALGIVDTPGNWVGWC